VIDIGCGHGWSSIALCALRTRTHRSTATTRTRTRWSRRDNTPKDAGSGSIVVRFHTADGATIDATADLAYGIRVHPRTWPNRVEVLGAARKALFPTTAR
jgi:hypothetical protein